jgi:hypothetical protein
MHLLQRSPYLCQPLGYSSRHGNNVSHRVPTPCTEPDSRALLPLPSHGTGRQQDVTGQQVADHRETRRMRRDVTRTHALPKSSVVIIPHKSMPQDIAEDIIVGYGALWLKTSL